MGKRHRGKRSRAREMALQMLYQRDIGGSSLEQIFASFEIGSGSGKDGTSFEHARALVAGTVEQGEAIDELIRRHAENWRLERMPAIARNIRRLAVYALLHREGVPKIVVVDEAIELAKKFGSEDSGRFVNGLLDAVLHSHLATPAIGGPA